MGVTFGRSESNTKTVRTPAGYSDQVYPKLSCPSVVSKDNWAGKVTSGDVFTITQNGTTVSAKRTDNDGGWRMQLRIICTLSVRMSTQCTEINLLHGKLDMLHPGKKSIHFSANRVTPDWRVPDADAATGFYHINSMRPSWMETSRCNRHSCVPCDKRSSRPDADGCFVAPTYHHGTFSNVLQLRTVAGSDLHYSKVTVTLKCEHENEELQVTMKVEGPQTPGIMKV